MIRNRLVRVLGIAVAGIALAGGSAVAATGKQAAAPATKITVKMREFNFDTSSDIAKAGKITFVVKNAGNTVHNYFFPDINKGSKFIQPGQSQTFVLTLKPGTYRYICTIPRHAENGMAGALVVK